MQHRSNMKRDLALPPARGLLAALEALLELDSFVAASIASFADTDTAS